MSIPVGTPCFIVGLVTEDCMPPACSAWNGRVVTTASPLIDLPRHGQVYVVEAAWLQEFELDLRRCHVRPEHLRPITPPDAAPLEVPALEHDA